VPGCNEYVSDLYKMSKESFLFWSNNSKPRSGPLCAVIRKSGAHFKYAFRQCRKDEDRIKADILGKQRYDRGYNSFWHAVDKETEKKTSIANTVGGVNGEDNVTNMWGGHFLYIIELGARQY